jgi:hypothetical protein
LAEAELAHADDAADEGGIEQRAVWSRQEVARLINEGLQSEQSAIPHTEATRVGRVVEVLLKDANPTHEEEARFVTGAMDALQYGLSSVRGQAFEAAARSLRWLDRAGDGVGTAPAKSVVRALVAERLDPATETSLGVRAIVGLVLPMLAASDR